MVFFVIFWSIQSSDPDCWIYIDIEIICQKLKVPLITCCPKDKLPTQKRKGYYIINMQNDKDEYGNDFELNQSNLSSITNDHYSKQTITNVH